MPAARFRHHPLVGTIVEIGVEVPDDGAATEAHRLDDLMVVEMVRLERVCSAYDAGSELERWKRGELVDPSPDFCTVMAASLAAQVDTGGAFNPSVGVLTRVWRAAESAGGEPPSLELLHELAASIAEPRYRIDQCGRPVPTGDCSALTLNAFAKGWIVERALERAWGEGTATSIVVNAGGDLAWRAGAGAPPLRAAIENPLRPYDNEPPLTMIELTEGGLATSGRARQGFRIGGRRYSHVIDPRRGQPVDGLASVTVLASSAAAADAMATLLGVLDGADAVAEADRRGLAMLRIAQDGTFTESSAWRRTATSAPSAGRARC